MGRAAKKNNPKALIFHNVSLCTMLPVEITQTLTFNWEKNSIYLCSYVMAFCGNLGSVVQSMGLWLFLLLCWFGLGRGSSPAKRSAFRAQHVPLLIPPPLQLFYELKRKTSKNNWSKQGSRCVGLSRNVQNPGSVLADARLCCQEICLARSLDIIINKQTKTPPKKKKPNKMSSLRATGELQSAIFSRPQARKMCCFFFPLEIYRDIKRISRKRPGFLLKEVENVPW